MKNQPLPEKNDIPRQKFPTEFSAVILMGTVVKMLSSFCFRSAFWQT
jgi:hypothetical protein